MERKASSRGVNIRVDEDFVKMLEQARREAQEKYPINISLREASKLVADYGKMEFSLPGVPLKPKRKA